MRIGSLFSGIGGLELGLERAGVGHTVWQVEQSEFCREVLTHHWPEALRYVDVKSVGADSLGPVDLICGGFPCQDISSAGKGAGLAGERSGLWFEYARIVGEMRPEWVVVENVASGANRWVDAVRAGLGELDYETLPIPLSAFDVGAPHLRKRVFIAARYANRDRQSTEPVDAEMAGVSGDSEPVADADSQHLRQQQRGSRGQGEEGTPLAGLAGEDGASTDANGEGLQRPEQAKSPGRVGAAGCAWTNNPMPEPAIRRMDDGPTSVVGRRSSSAPLRHAGRARRRNQELRALGNAVVPQCAEVIGHMIRELTAADK